MVAEGIRDAIESEQEDLLTTLLEHVPAQRHLVLENSCKIQNGLAAASSSLTRKRARQIFRSCPALCAELGDEFDQLFDQYKATQPSCSENIFLDAFAFSHFVHQQKPNLSDKSKVEFLTQKIHITQWSKYNCFPVIATVVLQQSRQVVVALKLNPQGSCTLSLTIQLPRCLFK